MAKPEQFTYNYWAVDPIKGLSIRLLKLENKLNVGDNIDGKTIVQIVETMYVPIVIWGYRP